VLHFYLRFAYNSLLPDQKKYVVETPISKAQERYLIQQNYLSVCGRTTDNNNNHFSLPNLALPQTFFWRKQFCMFPYKKKKKTKKQKSQQTEMSKINVLK